MNQVLTCPKCHGTMRTHHRNGVQIEQCDMCRGIFLDYGELEALARMGGHDPHAHAPPAYPQPPPMQHHPGWGHPQAHGWGKHHRYGGFARALFFSS